MNIGKRLFRRPFTTILWVVLAAAMSLLICTGAVMWYSAQRLPAALDAHHTSIAAINRAIYTEEIDFVEMPLYAEDIETLAGLDMVEQIDLRTLTAACCQDFTPALGEKAWGEYFPMEVYDHVNDSYNEVILSGTVERVWEYPYESSMDYDLSLLGLSQRTGMRHICALVTIEEIVLANPGYYFFENDVWSDYTGQIVVEIVVYNEEEADFLQVGERYLFSGMYDSVVSRRTNYTYDGNQVGAPDDIPFCPRLESFTRDFYSSYGIQDGDRLYRYSSTTQEETSEQPEAGGLPMGTIENPGLMKITEAKDKIPVAARLDGSVADFLAEESNADWVELISYWETVQHSLPVIGTENLASMFVFVENQATITAGRMFTQEEYDSGAKVVILSETVASQGDIQVGDTISLAQFLCGRDWVNEKNFTVSTATGDGLLNNPDIGYLPLIIDEPDEYEEFKVVGLYRLESGWNDSAFSITPNVVFMPQKAQIEGGFGGASWETEELQTFYVSEVDSDVWEEVTEMVPVIHENGVSGIYLSVIIENGRLEEFIATLNSPELENTNLAEAAPYFLTFDQGYEAASGSVEAVMESTQKMFVLTLGVWLLVLVLCTVLYQGTQRRNLGIMRALGASPGRSRAYLFGSGLAVIAAGVIVGIIISGAVASMMQEQLLALAIKGVVLSSHSGGMALTAEELNLMLGKTRLPVHLLALLAAAQMIVVAVVFWIQATVLSRKNPRKLLNG